MLISESRGLLYPNMYAILMGPPAIGKSQSIKMARGLLRETIAGAGSDKFHIGPDSISAASLIDALELARRDIPRFGEDPTYSFNSMFLMPDELADFMSTYDPAVVGRLTKFYDLEPYWDLKRSNKIDKHLDSVQLSLLAGTTPSKFHEVVKEAVWGQGFLSRTVVIYEDKKPIIDDIFNVTRRDSDDLRHDLNCLFSLEGQFTMSDDYKSAFLDWRRTGCAPVPTHPKFEHYNGRRETHLWKLSMVSSADRGDSLTIDRIDYDRAIGWLLEAERRMPEMFGVPTIDSAGIYDEFLHRLDGAEMMHTAAFRFLASRVAPQQIQPVIDTLIASGQMEMKIGRGGVKCYRRLR